MAQAQALGFDPRGMIDGEVRVPTSKSLAQRALVLASLAHGRTRLAALPEGGDARAALALVEMAGARVERLAPAAVAISGVPPGPHRGWSPAEALDVGESGTLARFATAALALCGRAGRAHRIEARGTLLQRSSAALFDALERAGARFEREAGVCAGGWPVTVRSIGPPSSVTIDAPRSSQEVSALVIALAAYPDAIELTVDGAIPSAPYLALTLGSVALFGARVESRGAGRFLVRGGLRAPADPLTIEPDASAAAVALAAACLSGGVARVRGLSARSLQGDVRIVEHLSHFGCDACALENELVARGHPSRGAHVDLAGEPDLAPVIAIVAAAAAQRGGGASVLSGLETLPGKESSRIDVLASALLASGFDVRHDAVSLSIDGWRAPPRVPLALDPHGDHRMAFAFALLGLVVPGVFVRDPACVAKSWPTFWQDLERAGARVSSPS